MKYELGLLFLSLVILIILAICFMTIAPVLDSSAQDDVTPEYFIYLPLVSKPVDPLATPTNSPTPTNTPRPTMVPTSTPTPIPFLATVYWNNRYMSDDSPRFIGGSRHTLICDE